MALCGIDQSKLLPAATVNYIDGKCKTVRERDALPRFKLAPEHVVGYPLYPEKTGFYIIKPKAIINHVRNPVFYNDLATYTDADVNAIRTNAISMDSGFSIRLNGNGDTSDPIDLRAYVETEIFGFIPGLQYTASAYIYQPQLFDVLDNALTDDFFGTISIVELDENDLEIRELVSKRSEKFQRWDRLGLTFNISSTATRILLRLNLRSQIKREIFYPYDPVLDNGGNQIFNDPNEYIFFDGLQFEQYHEATTPFHGDTNICGSCGCDSYKWLGFPHQSESYRSECARDGGVLVSLTELGLNILSHGGHDGMPVTNIAQPYANRPGSNYQKTILDSSRTLTFTGYECGCDLETLECQIFGLQNQLMPEIGSCGDCSQFLLLYQHGDDCSECDNEGLLAMCVVYRGGFEYTRDSRFRQNLTLQFEAFDPLAWFSYPIQQSIGLNFAQAIGGNKVIKIDKTGGYSNFPIGPNRDITDIACMPGNNRFVVGGSFDNINNGSSDSNLSLFACNEFCELITGGVANTVNVVKHTATGHVIYGGAFTARLGIIYGNSQFQASFSGFTGGEVWAIDKPFWGEIVAGTDNGIYVKKSDGSWLEYTTNGRVLDLQTDNLGNIYAVGEFTEIDGESFERVARLNVNQNGCLDIDNAVWESIGYGFDDTMQTIALDPVTNTLYFAGLADNATPDSVDICNDVIGRSTDSKSKGNECTFLYDTPMLFVLTSDNPQILESGGSALCTMDFTASTSGNFVASTGGFDNPDITGLVLGQNALRIAFPFPVTDLTLEFVGLAKQSEGFVNFNILPSSFTGYEVVNGNFYKSDDSGLITMTWDGPLSELEFNYHIFQLGGADGQFEWERLTFSHVSGGNNQQFTFEDRGFGVTRFEIALSNTIAQAFLEDCLTTTDITTLQKRYVRIVASNSQGINYNFLVGDDNLLNIETFTEAGMYIVRLDVNTGAVFPLPCSELNTPFANEFEQSNEDLALYSTLQLTGGVGIDNLLSTINIQCVVLDVTFQGDNILINGVAELNGANLTPLGDGFSTEVYDLMVNPNTREVWAGYDGGLRIWNGQDWFNFPGILSGSVIDMDFCPLSGDVYLLTDQDGGHVLPGITDIDYNGNFEQVNAMFKFHGPGDLSYMLDHCSNKQARFCASLECGDVADFQTSNGKITGSRDFGNTILGGSRLDFWLRKCEQKISLYIANDSGITKATLVYRDHFWSISALCCAKKTNSPLLELDNKCCQNHNFLGHRDPTCEDCLDQTYSAGDSWLNVAGECGPKLFINTGNCNDVSGGGLSIGGVIIIDNDTDSNTYCP